MNTQNLTQRGKGRPKGAKSKMTVLAKEAFAFAFTEIGGAQALAVWAGENQSEFYKLFARLIPTEVSGPDGGALETTCLIVKGVGAD